MKNSFPPEWRTQTRWKRRFYAKYMRTLERAGYLLVIAVFAAFIAAFNIPVEDLATADKVAIAPFARPLVAAGPTMAIRFLAKDFDSVVVGQPLVEVVTGDDAIRRYGDWKAVQDLAQRVSASETAALVARYPKPATSVLGAPVAGTFRLDAKEGTVVDDKGMIGRVVDYGDLRLEASLGGDTVSKAKIGDPARIVGIAIEPEAGTLFRGGDAVSGRLLGDRVRVALEKDLIGRQVALRDDIPLRVKEVSDIGVDAVVVPSTGGTEAGAVALDPPADLRVAAEVVDGHPSATVQVADLPPAIADNARSVVAAALKGRTVRRADGLLTTLGDARDVHLVVKLKVGAADSADANPLPGTMLSRTFDATLKLKSPPQFLIDAVRAADRAGKAVTARVELQTGTRPIALRLLKKS